MEVDTYQPHDTDLLFFNALKWKHMVIFFGVTVSQGERDSELICVQSKGE